MIDKRYIEIDGIPAILWGNISDKLFIAVHGDQSNKEDHAIVIFAEEAISKGYQVLSFDLPEHGDRKNEHRLCIVQNCVEDLYKIISYARSLTNDISLFGCSLGAYFGMVAYKDEPLKQALFLSPVVDMKRIIENMMMWFNVSEEQLKSEKEVVTPIKTLYWEYYCYVIENPIEWNKTHTALLYGENDNLCEFDYVSDFANRFSVSMEIMEDGEHFFHTEEQLEFFRKWLQKNILVRS